MKGAKGLFGFRKWQPHWFVIKNAIVHYYKEKLSDNPSGNIKVTA